MNEIVKTFDFAPSVEIDKRDAQAQEFYRVALSPEEEPCFVADEATIWGVYFEDDPSALIEKCRRHYGVALTHDHFSLPLWKVLDFLEARRFRPSHSI